MGKAGSFKERSATVQDLGNLNLDANMGKEEYIGVGQGINVKEKVLDVSKEIKDDEMYKLILIGMIYTRFL